MPSMIKLDYRISGGKREGAEGTSVARRARLFRASDLWGTHNVEFRPEHRKKEKMGRENEKVNYKTKAVGYAKKKRTSYDTSSIRTTISPDIQVNNTDDSSYYTLSRTFTGRRPL